MIIDVHNHMGLSRDGGHSKIEEILENMEASKIAKSVVFAIDEEGYQPTYKKQNDKVIAARDKFPERLGAIEGIPLEGFEPIAFREDVLGGFGGVEID